MDARKNNRIAKKNRIYKKEILVQDEASQYYEPIYSEMPFAKYSTKKYSDRIARLAKDDYKILEIGCGTGSIIRELKKKNVKSGLIGIDISQKMVNIGIKKTNSPYVCCLGEKLPFKNGTFDIIFGTYVLHHMPDLPSFFKEISRVLTNQGEIIFFEPTESNTLLNRLSKKLVSPLIFIMKLKNRKEIESLPPRHYSWHKPVSVANFHSISGFNFNFEYSGFFIKFFVTITFNKFLDKLIFYGFEKIDIILTPFLKGFIITITGSKDIEK
jgi:ubiquinone/menaquinone biosynthesis C-methylase UbiE